MVRLISFIEMDTVVPFLTAINRTGWEGGGNHSWEVIFSDNLTKGGKEINQKGLR